MRKLAALTRRWDLEHERSEYQIGMLCAVFANYGARAPEEALEASDFVPERRRRPAAQLEVDPEDLRRRMRKAMGRLKGGLIVKDAAGNVIERPN